MAPKRSAPRTAARKVEPRKTATGLGKDPDEGHPSFSFRYIDKDGPWSWARVSQQHKAQILDFIGDMCSLSWPEIAQQRDSRGQKHHYQHVDSIDADARKRLSILKLEDDTDWLYRFRLGNKQRLWGFRKQGVFQAIWWDPRHTVYPTEPKGT